MISGMYVCVFYACFIYKTKIALAARRRRRTSRYASFESCFKSYFEVLSVYFFILTRSTEALSRKGERGIGRAIQKYSRINMIPGLDPYCQPTTGDEGRTAYSLIFGIRYI